MRGKVPKRLSTNASEPPKRFLASSYVIQNLDNSVLTLTPGEQLNFVENLSLDKDAIERERHNLKKHIASVETQKVQAETKLACAKGSLLTFESFKEPECPRSTVSKEDISSQQTLVRQKKKELEEKAQAVKEIKERIKSTLLSLERLEGEKKHLVVEDKVEKDEIYVLEKKRDKAKALEALKAKVEERKKYESFMEEREKHLLAEEELSELISRKKLLKQKKETSRKFQEKKRTVASKLETISVSVRKEFPTKCEATVSSLSRHLNKKADVFSQQVQKLEDEVVELSQEKAKAELEKDVLTCPCCQEDLVFSGGKLEKFGSKRTGKDLKKLEKLLVEKKKELSCAKKSLEKAKQFISDLSKCILTESVPDFADDEELSRISSRIKEDKKFRELPRWVVELEKNTKALKEDELKVLEEGCSTNLQEVQRELDRIKDKFKQQTLMLQKLADVETKISRLKKSMPSEPKEEEKEVEQLLSLTKQEEEKLSRLQEEQVFALEWRSYDEKIKEKQKLVETVQLLGQELSVVEKSIKDALLLKEKSRTATFLAVEKTVQSINYAAKQHLDKLFEDDPISILLKTNKETKKGKKIQMSVQIFYKGHEYDSFWSLSGGERQKACLSFILAINEVVSSKFLLLDEALAQLHKEVNTGILEYLRDEVAKQKLVVVVSHEANRGIFHKVIEI
ncbi:hypothetical protein GMAR_ORF35 [Golden Marseillevirus]|uniref:hypothetical protein n=1 Tax=Golden Marseillevirus TaxID=1720526 RepID=UPI000877AE0C|nr:hypothetical protein GMAR_ORF35 [Golden Marseillevirus]ALX27410.1 hypothetical protein GMAR_ORF35 [Golden Marseillevirus]